MVRRFSRACEFWRVGKNTWIACKSKLLHLAVTLLFPLAFTHSQQGFCYSFLWQKLPNPPQKLSVCMRIQPVRKERKGKPMTLELRSQSTLDSAIGLKEKIAVTSASSSWMLSQKTAGSAVERKKVSRLFLASKVGVGTQLDFCYVMYFV